MCEWFREDSTYAHVALCCPEKHNAHQDFSEWNVLQSLLYEECCKASQSVQHLTLIYFLAQIRLSDLMCLYTSNQIADVGLYVRLYIHYVKPWNKEFSAMENKYKDILYAWLRPGFLFPLRVFQISCSANYMMNSACTWHNSLEGFGWSANGLFLTVLYSKNKNWSCLSWLH